MAALMSSGLTAGQLAAVATAVQVTGNLIDVAPQLAKFRHQVEQDFPVGCGNTAQGKCCRHRSQPHEVAGRVALFCGQLPDPVSLRGRDPNADREIAFVVTVFVRSCHPLAVSRGLRERTSLPYKQGLEATKR